MDSSSPECGLEEVTQRKDSACGGHTRSGDSEEDTCGVSFRCTSSSWSRHKGTDCNASSHHNGELETDLSPGELLVPPNNTTLCSPSSLVLMLGRVPHLSPLYSSCCHHPHHFVSPLCVPWRLIGIGGLVKPRYCGIGHDVG